MKTGAVLLYVTCASMDEARMIAANMVEKRLAACANILPGMVSVYQWQGKIEQDQETVLILKTRRALAKDAMSMVADLHSYDTPAILQLDVSDGHPDWLGWLDNETRQPSN